MRGFSAGLGKLLQKSQKIAFQFLQDVLVICIQRFLNYDKFLSGGTEDKLYNKCMTMYYMKMLL